MKPIQFCRTQYTLIKNVRAPVDSIQTLCVSFSIKTFITRENCSVLISGNICESVVFASSVGQQIHSTLLQCLTYIQSWFYCCCFALLQSVTFSGLFCQFSGTVNGDTKHRAQELDLRPGITVVQQSKAGHFGNEFNLKLLVFSYNLL